MEYKSVEELTRLGRVEAEAKAPPPMSQLARLDRWADILEAEPGRRLNTFFETEYQLPVARDTMRSAGSPISIAFADATLRADGLTDDTYGTAKRYFGLNDRQLHQVLCYCHYGSTVSAGTAARALRGVIESYAHLGFHLARVRRIFA